MILERACFAYLVLVVRSRVNDPYTGPIRRMESSGSHRRRAHSSFRLVTPAANVTSSASTGVNGLKCLFRWFAIADRSLEDPV